MVGLSLGSCPQAESRNIDLGGFHDQHKKNCQNLTPLPSELGSSSQENHLSWGNYQEWWTNLLGMYHISYWQIMVYDQHWLDYSSHFILENLPNPVFEQMLPSIQNGDLITQNIACSSMNIDPRMNYPRSIRSWMILKQNLDRKILPKLHRPSKIRYARNVKVRPPS